MLETTDRRSIEPTALADAVPADAPVSRATTLGRPDGAFLKTCAISDLMAARRLLMTGADASHGSQRVSVLAPITSKPLEGADLERAIHLARRRLKRVRSLFLVLKSIAGCGHVDCVQTVKLAFQRLSGPRDLDAMLQAARSLVDRARPNGQATAMGLVKRLEARASAMRAIDTPVDEVVHLLRMAEVEVASLAEIDDPAHLLRRQLIATYAKGRKLFRRARDSDDVDDETLHDWRKQVKHRMHLGEILAQSRIAQAVTPIRALDRLADDLGEEHDLANLAAWIRTDPENALDRRDLTPLLAIIRRRRAKLTARAFKRGVRLYGETPAQYAASIS